MLFVRNAFLRVARINFIEIVDYSKMKMREKKPTLTLGSHIVYYYICWKGN